jgi:aryl-alcohol dehydrogenase-like predicted oxidoreductase
MRMRMIGDVKVSALGYGAAHLSVPDAIDRDQALRTLHAALDAGLTFIDTALAYSPWGDDGHNEALVAEALASWSGDTADVLVGTKGGHFRSGERSWGVDGHPEAIKRNCRQSLRALGVESIGLYTLHLPDPDVPLSDSIGALKDLRDEGLVRAVGVSNLSVEQIEQARSIVEVAAVQNRYSPLSRESARELEYCSTEQIAFTPYGVLGGKLQAPDVGGLSPVFGQVASDRGVSPQRVVLAWALARSPVVIPLCGARRPESIRDSAPACDLVLSDEELTRLDASVPAQ